MGWFSFVNLLLCDTLLVSFTWFDMKSCLQGLYFTKAWRKLSIKV